MGLVGSRSKPGYHDRRYRLSSLVVPTRVKPSAAQLVGVKGFRLRFGAEGTRQVDPTLPLFQDRVQVLDDARGEEPSR